MSIANGKQSIENIFINTRFFEIPNYQRSYAWEQKQLDDFLEDFSFIENCNQYYYGTILLQKKENSENRYEIVDGQQRITTLIIFINCLIKKMKQLNFCNDDINELEKQYIEYKTEPKLKLQDYDNGFFKSYILSDNRDPIIKSPAQKKLLKAKNYFNEKLEDCTQEDLKAYVTRIQAANCLVYCVTGRNEAAMIFETTNDRGKLLTNLEKAKSFLMYKVSTTFKDSPSLIDTIQEGFQDIYQTYEDLCFKQKFNLNENSIQQYAFIAFEKWKHKQISGKKSYKEYQHYLEELKLKTNKLIFEINSTKNEEERELKEKAFSDYVRKYINNLRNSFNAISHMYKNKYDEFFKLLSIDRMASIYPLLIKAHINDKTQDKSNFSRLCKLCEIFCFRGLTIIKYLSNKYQDKLFSMARDFDGNFKNLFDELKVLIISLGDKEKFLNKLQNKDFYKEYSSQDRNYFFWSYENYLRNQKGKGYPNLTFEHLWEKNTKKRLTIEHIIAQANDKDKFHIIKNDKFIKIGQRKQFDKEHLHSIGNLTIDPQSANSAKGKSDFETKNSKFFRESVLLSQQELDRFLEKEKWTSESLKRRKEALLEFAEKTWCFETEKTTHVVIDESNDEVEEDINDID